jgi:hypothetical protein
MFLVYKRYSARYGVSTLVLKIPLFIGIHRVNWYRGTVVSEEIVLPTFRLAQETSNTLKIIAPEA